MNFERCKRGLRSDRRGVSEVVGNILILMITVILFSAIVAYVNQIPVPEMTTKADFAASVTFETAGNTTATLTVTHAGGEVLDAAETAIYVEAGTSSSYDKLSEDADFPYSQWTTGTDWIKDFTVPSESTEIIVTVIDLVRNSAVWTSQVSGGAGGTPPIILQRYLDTNIETPTADPVKEGDEEFSFYVKVIDLDNDLDESTSGVWIDSSELKDGESVDTYEEATSDGWFRFDFGDIADPVTLADGKTIKIHAKDDAGHETISTFVVSVTVLPVDIERYPYTETFEGGLPAYITWMNDGQGFGIYGENETSGLADTDDARSAFVKDEIIFIRVASLRLANIFGVNSLTMVDMRTGITYVPEYQNSSSASTPFYPYTSSGGAFIYECTFSTEGLPPSAYSLAVTLKSSGVTTAVFQTVKGILITEDDSPIEFMPEITLYKDDDYSTEWGTKTNPFDLMDPDAAHVYAKVHVEDAQASPVPLVDDIRLVDMRGDTQLHGTPPSGDMITEWYDNSTDDTYEFGIDLRLNNGDHWIGGTNAYTLKISRFSDLNEGVYSLSAMVYIRASTARADFILGGAGFMTGTSNFVNPAYLYYIENNNFFTKRTLYDYSNAPSAADNYAASALVLGDIDGDGDKDLLMGQYNSNNLYYLENSLNTFGSWQEVSQLTRPSSDPGVDTDILGLACGDTNGDGDIDFAYATMGNTVVLYNNTYGAQGYFWKDYDDESVSKIALEDLTGDGRADLIVLVDGRIEIFDMIEWDSSSVLCTIGDSNSDIKDFDIADVNLDGYLDIATTDTATVSGAKGAYVWYYEPGEPTAVKLYDEYPTPDYGRVVSGQISDTFAYDGNALQVGEAVDDPTYPGFLRVDMETDTLSTDQFQQLTVRAKVSAEEASPSEGFNIWYSVDGSVFTPLIYIPASQTTLANFTAPLSSNVAGMTLTIRVTDSVNSSGSTDPLDILHIDYLAIITDTFGGFVGEPVFDTSPTTVKHDCVRIGNIDGTSDGYLEVILGRDHSESPYRIGEWQVYKRAGVNDWDPLSGWYDSSTSFFVRGDDEIKLHSSMSSDENAIEAILSQASPRLFQVEDVNGDGFSDIIVSNVTISEYGIISQIALYLNMNNVIEGDPWWYYVVKDIAGDYTITDIRGGLTCLLVDNLVE